MLRLLFLCTGNSCRSQMAEGWARKLAGDRLQAASAGIEAHGKNPRAVAVMQEVGVDISDQESTILTDEMLNSSDLLITVCGHADEHCPVLPAGTRKEHWPIADPARAEGSKEEIMEIFRATRDEIRQHVAALIERIEKERSTEQ